MTDSISIPAGSPALSDVFAEPAWLAEHLNDPGVRVVEVDVSRVAYNQGHIPGAVLWNALDFQLTNREQEVLHLVAKGYTDRRIAQSLIISPRTVNRHLSNIFVKLAVSCRTAAVAYAIRLGLI